MDKNGKMRVGIVGAGNIAAKAAQTLNAMKDCDAYAIASRSPEKAEEFAAAWNIPKAYGTYKAAIDDPDIDLLYIATPHSHHYEVTREALLNGKACLVEKSFMANYRQAKDIIELAGQQKVFLAEAIWTRYQPAAGIIRKLIADGEIGNPKLITATLGYLLSYVERIQNPALCGGALLDLGVYVLNFVRMYTQGRIVSIDGQCIKTMTGVDISNSISIIFDDGVLASVQSSADCVGNNIGVISGTEGNIIVDGITNPKKIIVNGPDRIFKKEINLPEQITGYEYQFEACRKALIAGKLQVDEMPWSEILYIMSLMDSLREKWGVRFPMD